MKKNVIVAFLISLILAVTFVLSASIQPPYQSFAGHYKALIQADAPSGNGYGGTLVYDTSHSTLYVNTALLGQLGSSWSNIAQANTAMTTAGFTTANASGFQAITGLSFTIPGGVAQNIPVTCNIKFTQASNVFDSFGVQDVTTAPTRIDGYGIMSLAGPGFIPIIMGSLINLTTTTATAIVSGTPSVTTANFVQTNFTVQQPAGVATTIQMVVSQATAADVLVILPGSNCVLY